tara:strand:- start:6053 stop:6676 length:624 start_codon:yes stop_codon:yes gene_type:complete
VFNVLYYSYDMRMCSRFEISSSAREIMQALSLKAPPPLPNKPEVRPTDAALMVLDDAGKRISELRPWGLRVDWTTQPMINARAETLSDKPTFRPLLENRCVLPASAYFEWRKTENGEKRKNRIYGKGLLVMAGLFDAERVTIVTCAPASSIQHIHNRMPVLLDQDGIQTWLSGAPFSHVAGVLVPFTGPLTFDEETPPPSAQQDLFG